MKGDPVARGFCAISSAFVHVTAVAWSVASTTLPIGITIGRKPRGFSKRRAGGITGSIDIEDFCAECCGGPSRRVRDLPGRDAIACGPALQPKGQMPSRGGGLSPFHRLSNKPRGPSDRWSPFPVRAVSSCGVETRWLWSSLTLPICRRCLRAQLSVGDGCWDRSGCDIPTHLRQKKGRLGSV